MKRRLLESLGATLLIALAVVVQNRLATAWAVTRASRAAGERVAHLARGSTPLVWPMEDSAELHWRPSRGVALRAAEAGVLHLETEDRDPYLFLDLGGETFQACDHPILRTGWSFDEDTWIQIHFWEPGNGEPRASKELEMRSGFLEASFDLRLVPFHRVCPGEPETVWGGRSGAVDHFRIDLGDRAGARIVIDRIALDPPPGAPTWPEAYARLREILRSGEAIPSVEASALHGTEALPRAPWVRVLFTHERSPCDPPRDFDPHASGTRCIGCFRWPLALPVETALAVAAGWAGKIDFFEAHFPWPTPEQWIQWKKAWDRGAGTSLFPRKARAKDLPAVTPPPLPGREKRSAHLEPVRWGVMAGSLLFFTLMSFFRLRGREDPGAGRAGLELLGLWISIQWALAVFPRFNDARVIAVFSAALLFLVLSVSRRGPATKEGEKEADPSRLRAVLRRFGLDGVGRGQAGWTALGVTLVGLAGLWIVGSSVGAFRMKSEALLLFPEYLGKALAQQALLGPFLARRFETVLGNRRTLAAAGAAVVFSSLHLPNGTLTAATLLMGFLWAVLYLRHQKLLPLVVSHAVLGTVLASTLTTPVLVSHHVGLKFFTG
ncbi:MAG: lysostaphin resistance A-like protein [Planctomycetota bacterium]